eukprot:10957619-Alexandrium_andersonii.AAC.1
MSASLVGSEMCIRDSENPHFSEAGAGGAALRPTPPAFGSASLGSPNPVSYTHLTLPTICSV